jgi:small subunit ribosomal protein S18
MTVYNKRVKKKVCILCKKGVEHIDYKDIRLIQKYTTLLGKITPKRISGACSKHQRRISSAIKRARIVALLPFVRD